MSGDFTRDTFRPAKAYSAVRMQQGRLFTDADWNEEGDIARDALRRTAASVIGTTGFPEDNPGFGIVPSASGGFILTPGEAYVDGIRVVLPPAPTLSLKRISGTGPATKWQVVNGARVAVGDQLLPLTQPIEQGPVAQASLVTALLPDVGGRQVLTCTALSGFPAIQVRLYRSLESQPFLARAQLPPFGQYVAYLAVWEREVSALEDPLIREAAFGGPDTATRDQIVWQVRYAKYGDLLEARTVPASCSSFGPGWTPFGAKTPRGAMAARAQAGSAATDPCVLPSTGGYRSLENHLYRVEIHNGGDTGSGTVRVKWSRDNGIHRAGYAEIDGNAIVVDSVGRDQETAFKVNDWVEILDEARLLSGRPGFFAQISDVNGNRVAIGKILDPDTLQPLPASGPPNMTGLPPRGTLTRWEGGVPQTVAPNGWIKLENGVEVQFAPGYYEAQDYWTVPARTIPAAIEWPLDPVTGAPALVPAMGIIHHYCALALMNPGPGGSWQLTDCRSLFAPLTRLRGFHYLGGDGQEAMPDPLNPALIKLKTPLRCGYVRGRTPVQGASVEFKVVDGSDGLLENGTNIQTVPTDANGIASVFWSVDATHPHQQVCATLRDSANRQIHLPILYTASLSMASETSFNSTGVAALAGTNTVQEAIEKLASLQQVGCSTYVIVADTDWVSVLKGLQPHEDATICFQRGTYTTDETVLLEGLGHIILCGAGGGTRIIGRRRECALEFLACASVTIHDLDISTPDGTGAIQNFTRRSGTLTMEDCGTVDVHDLTLSCGAGVAAERTCLTVRGTSRPTSSVRILRNRLTVGYQQDGILVTDCNHAVIEDNEIGVLPRPQSLPPVRLFEAGGWRRRLIGTLVNKPVSEDHDRFGGDIKYIRGGAFTADFLSIVPQGEWDLLIEQHPPAAADLNSAAEFNEYVQRTLDLALVPEHMPASLLQRMTTLMKGKDQGAFEALDKGVRLNFLVASEPEVQRIDEAMARPGAIVIAAMGERILFDSPLGQGHWEKAFQMMPPNGRSRGLVHHAERIARRIIVDAPFREGLAGAKAWYNSYVQALPAFGWQAITCGGKLLGEISISRNRVEGFVQGVHVGTSREWLYHNMARPVVLARNVSVRDNALFLRLPGLGAYAPFGLFVGNCETTRIENNTFDWASPRPADDTMFAHGIRVWGHLGRFLLIAGNRIRIASIGIRVRSAERIDPDDFKKYAWTAADNLADSSQRVLKAPPFMEDRNNRPG